MSKILNLLKLRFYFLNNINYLQNGLAYNSLSLQSDPHFVGSKIDSFIKDRLNGVVLIELSVFVVCCGSMTGCFIGMSTHYLTAVADFRQIIDIRECMNIF